MTHWAEFGTPQDTARTTGVSVATVRRWLKTGLPYSQPKPGGRILIKREDLERFLESGRRQDAAAFVDRCIEEVLKDLQNKTASKAATSDAANRKGTSNGEATSE